MSKCDSTINNSQLYVVKSIKKFNFEELEAYQFSFKLPGLIKLGVHLFYIDGLLIDTGASRLRREILNTFKNKISVQQIFLTHHHEDHSGNLIQFKNLYDCPIYATPACCLMMKKPPPISFAQRVYWGNRPSFNELIPIQNKIETNNFRFEIIPTLGHAVDMAVLYEPRKKWMIVSDLYVSYYINYFIENEMMAAQISSIKNVLSYDWDYMFCSHNPNIRCNRSELEAKLQFLESFYEKVAMLYHKGFDAKQIFNQLNMNENWVIKFFSGSHLSKMNMVKSVIRDERRKL